MPVKSPKPPINGKKPSEPAAPPPPELLSAPVQRRLEEVVLHWQKTLANRPGMHKHLLQLGVTGKDIEELGTGFSDGRLGELVPPSSEEGRARRELLFACGILDGFGNERFAGCLVFPVMDAGGHIVNVYGITPDGSREVFLPYPCPLYNVRALIAQDVTVTRSIFEFLSRYGKGQRNVVFAHAGLSGEEIESLLERRPAPAEPEGCVHVMLEPEETDGVRIGTKGKTLFCALGDRAYRIDGFFRNLAAVALAVTLEVSRAGKTYTSKPDLLDDRLRERFIRGAAKKLETEEKIIEGDVDVLLGRLRKMQDTLIAEKEKPREETPHVMTDAERAEALEVLTSEDPLERIADLIEETGVVGERLNIKAAFLASLTRMLPEPLHVIFQAETSAGKSTLMKAVVDTVPPESKQVFTEVSKNALYYFQGDALKHRTLGIMEDFGIGEAAQALKTLMTDGMLRKAATMRDPDTGRSVTGEYTVEGPVQAMTSANHSWIVEDLQNRTLILVMNATAGQNRLIHEMKRRERKLGKRPVEMMRARTVRLLQNVQRLTLPLVVRNPYVDHLTFPHDSSRTRRDFDKYLTLIEAHALLNQYRRRRITLPEGGVVFECVEVAVEDIRKVNPAAEVIFSSSLDDLGPITRSLLDGIRKMTEQRCVKEGITREACTFTRRQVRAYTKWTEKQVRSHLERLVQFELAHPVQGRQGAVYLYRLDPDLDESGLSLKLADPESLPEAVSK